MRQTVGDLPDCSRNVEQIGAPVDGVNGRLAEEAVRQSRRMREEVLDGDWPRRSLKRWRHGAAARIDVCRGERRNELRKRIVEAQLAVFGELENRDGDDGLRHRVDAKHAVGPHWRFVRDVHVSDRLRVRDFSVSRDERDHARQFARVDIGPKRGRDSRERRWREARAFGTNSRESLAESTGGHTDDECRCAESAWATPQTVSLHSVSSRDLRLSGKRNCVAVQRHLAGQDENNPRVPLLPLAVERAAIVTPAPNNARSPRRRSSVDWSAPMREAHSVERRPHHDLPNQQPRRPVRDRIRLRRLALRVAARAELLILARPRDAVEVAPEVRRDRVVRHVRHLTRDLAVLDLPEDVAAELAVVPLLVDRVAAAAVDHHAVLHVGDELVALRRVGRSRLQVHVRHAEERIVAPRVRERAAAAEVLADEVRGLAVGLQADEDAVADDRALRRLHAVVVVGVRAEAVVGLVGRDVHVLRAVLELSDVGNLDEARAGVVRLVADDAIDFRRVRDDLVDRQHRVRRRENQIAQAARAERLGGAHLDRVGRDPLRLTRGNPSARRFPSRPSPRRPDSFACA